jgi:hypothetical protein
MVTPWSGSIRAKQQAQYFHTAFLQIILTESAKTAENHAAGPRPRVTLGLRHIWPKHF